MMSSSVHTRSLRSCLQTILKLQSQSILITYSLLAAGADISTRHVSNCLLALKAQEVVTWERDPNWRGTGVRYLYTVNKMKAQEHGYIDQDFLDLLDLTRQRAMAQAA